MASYLLRRSGIAVCMVAEYMKWQPDWIYQVGVGTMHEETIVLREAWPEAQFVGFEPCRKSYEDRLKGNVKKLGRKFNDVKDKYPNTFPGELRHCAISDYDGSAELYVPSRHRDGASLWRPTETPLDHAESTTVYKLDTLYPDGPKGEHILLWLDCEGSELAALKGGVKFVESVDMINIELTAKPSIEYCPDPLEVHNYLRSIGFLRQWVHTQRGHVGQCDVVYVRPHMFREEFCCCPCAVEAYRLQCNC